MNSALILIDIQNDYFSGGKMELVHAREAAMEGEKLLKTARANNIPIIYIQHLATRPESGFFIPGTEGVEIYELIRPKIGETIIQKNYPNSFRETSLAQTLEQAGIRHLIICGMMTHMCVDATVRAAADLGYQCTLAEDACATLNLTWNTQTIPADAVQGSFLAALSGFYANILPTTEIIKKMTDEYT